MSAGKMYTAQDYLAWDEANRAAIESEHERNYRAVLDEVIRQVLSARQMGHSLDAIGDSLMASFFYGTRGGVTRTPEAVQRALREIGWRPRRERARGGRQ